MSPVKGEPERNSHSDAIAKDKLRGRPSKDVAMDQSSPVTKHPTLRAANEARQIEWDKDNNISLAYRGNELAGEVGEACNVIKKLERERLGIRGSRATTEQLAEELADAVICVDLIAMQAGIDLNAAVQAKFNATSEKYGLATRMSDAAATTQQRQRIDHPSRPDEADYEYDDLQRRIETLGGPAVVVGILQMYALASPRQGSYAGSLWAIAEWLNERLCGDAAQPSAERGETYVQEMIVGQAMHWCVVHVIPMKRTILQDFGRGVDAMRAADAALKAMSLSSTDRDAAQPPLMQEAIQRIMAGVSPEARASCKTVDDFVDAIRNAMAMGAGSKASEPR